MVQQLREQLRIVSESQRQNASSGSDNSSRAGSASAEFRIVSDLNKTVKEFCGRETACEADDWFESVNTLARINNCPDGYILQFIRS